MASDFLEQLFPALRQIEFAITSPRDASYNCVAWAAGDVTRWWWPAEAQFTFWPAGIEREESLASFVLAFNTLGFELAASGDHESDYEKVAIFASRDGTPTHMARQLADGAWTSKLGGLEDIRHSELNGVAGTEYGNVVAILRRKKPPLS